MTNKIFYLTNDPERALGLENLLPNFHILCIDHNDTVDELMDRGVNIFCLEKVLKEKNVIFRNSNKLLNHPKTLEYLRQHGDPAQDYLMTFKISPSFEKTSAELGYKILNTTSKLNRMLENKLSQHKFLSKNNANIPRSFCGVLEDQDFESIVSEVEKPFVIQFDRGHTGTGTLFIETKMEYDAIRDHFPKRRVKFSKFVNGEAWTLNAVITKLGVFYGGLSYQITGIPELTDKDGATVGNDWTKCNELSEQVICKISEMTQSIGIALYKEGYQGMFGLDVIISEEDVILIEINARQPASTSMHTKLMLENGQVPLELLHILEFISNDNLLDSLGRILTPAIAKKDIEDRLKVQNLEMSKGYRASQFVIRNQSDHKIVLRDEMRSGIYSDNHVRIRGGYSISDIVDPNEYLLITTAPDRYISEGSELARIQSKDSVLNKDGELKERYKKLIDKINSMKII